MHLERGGFLCLVYKGDIYVCLLLFIPVWCNNEDVGLGSRRYSAIEDLWVTWEQLFFFSLTSQNCCGKELEEEMLCIVSWASGGKGRL